MTKLLKRLIMILLISYLTVSLSGCILCLRQGNIFGTSSYVFEQTSEDSLGNSTTMLSMILNVAVVSVLATGGIFNLNYQDVHYSPDIRNYPVSVGFTGLDESAEQSSPGVIHVPNQFLGWLIDPAVVQVPNEVTNLTATYDGGTGKQGNLVVTEGLQSVPITPTQSLVPEPGHHLVIMDFPDVAGLIPGPGAPEQWYGINIQAEVSAVKDIDIKVICTGKVEKDGATYYVPLMPAVSDFALVPPVTIPSSTSLEDLTIPTPEQMPAVSGTVMYDFNYKLFYPHIASNTNWETETCVINTSSTQTLTGTLKAYNNSGTLVDSKAVTLAPNARAVYTVGTAFTTPSNIGYMIFESDSPSMVGYMKFYVDARYRGAIPAASQVNSGEVYVSHIASNTNWWTGISLLNTTDASKTLTITFDNGQTRDVTLAANEHKVLSIKSLFGGTPQPGIKSAVITNTSGIVGLELFGSNAASANSYLSGVLLRDVTATDLFFPHIANYNTWWTGIVGYNPSSLDADLTITPYQKDGSKLTAQTITLNAESKYIGNAQGLNFPSTAAWFHIASTQALSGFELFGTDNGNQLGGYTSVGITRTSGVFPKIETNGWTGIALVNTQEVSATVILTAYDDSGAVIASRGLTLNPHEKLVSPADQLFTQNISAATYIGFTSTQSIVGFQLNGSTDNMLLDALPGM